MATLLQFKNILALVALGAPLAQASAACEFIESYIQIQNWTEPQPKNVHVEIIPSNTLEEKKIIKYKAIITEPVAAYGRGRGLALIRDEEPVHRFKVTDSYVIFFNNSPIYRITNIKSTNQIQLACPIQSFQVNECTGTRGPNLSFDAACR
ncbi:hypothetical protein [Ideonella paludis]|uniref:Uncharacterized protein n=1 Tax=Ideonella paludis TaxID=1233411 RepID=A0ABS5DV30_9BURK|nr:hypothetical protein [Ideonella paludis]MBQ0934992.1 hypothetical protein [Ideonella paludis]